MNLINIRHQHSVGQGFFHSAKLLENRSERLRYVYDCGSSTKYAEARTERIEKYLSEFKQHDRRLDIAFISHAHADHINGIAQLLDNDAGLNVDTIVMPYINIYERLLSFAYCANVDPASTKDNFYRQFVSDPIEALSSFKPRQIIQIRPATGRGPSTPDSGGEPDSPAPDISGPIDSEERITWKIVGEGKIIQDSKLPRDSADSAVRVIIIEDKLKIAIRAYKSETYCWLLSPFIDHAIEPMQMIFKTALLKALNHGKPRNQKIKKSDFDNWLQNSKNIEHILINNLADLQDAYSTVEKNVNFTSMCLYSGPPSDSKVFSKKCEFSFGKWRAVSYEKIGWLATGDADLKTKNRRVSFFKHYGNLIKNVSTLTIPHHGSENNFDSDLITKIDPLLCVVAADTVGKWRHPGTKIVQSIASQGSILSVVTASICSEVHEYAEIR